MAGTTTGGFPGTAGGAQATFGGSGNSGSGDAFVVRLNNALTAISQATYLGGSLDDIANGIAVDWAGVFVTGGTYSTNFPGTAGGAQATYGGGTTSGNGGDAFVAKLTTNLQTLIQATYLGGSVMDEATAIVLDASGNVFVAGSTNSSNFPGMTGPQASKIGPQLCFCGQTEQQSDPDTLPGHQSDLPRRGQAGCSLRHCAGCDRQCVRDGIDRFQRLPGYYRRGAGGLWRQQQQHGFRRRRFRDQVGQ